MDPVWWELVLGRQRALCDRDAVRPYISETVTNSTPDTWIDSGLSLDYYVPPWATYLWIRYYHRITEADSGVGKRSESRLLINGSPAGATYGTSTTLYDREVDLIQDVSAYRDSIVTLGVEVSANVKVASTALYSIPFLSTKATRPWSWLGSTGEEEEEVDPGPGPGVNPEAVVLIVESPDELPTASASWRNTRALVRSQSGTQDEERICLKLSDDTYEWRISISGGTPI